MTTTDNSKNEAVETPLTFTTAQDFIELTIGAHSMNTLEIEIRN